MKIEQLDGRQLTYDDSPEAHKRVYDIALAWFKKVEHFNGESLAQSDVVYIEAPEILSSIAEDGFKFQAKWEE